ncbi:MAG: hypothetical protein RI911_131 [Candidatus Parcubacteria bacterium]|jgi:hypothetical protein
MNKEKLHDGHDSFSKAEIEAYRDAYKNMGVVWNAILQPQKTILDVCSGRAPLYALIPEDRRNGAEILSIDSHGHLMKPSQDAEIVKRMISLDARDMNMPEFSAMNVDTALSLNGLPYLYMMNNLRRLDPQWSEEVAQYIEQEDDSNLNEWYREEAPKDENEIANETYQMMRGVLNTLADGGEFRFFPWDRPGVMPADSRLVKWYTTTQTMNRLFDVVLLRLQDEFSFKDEIDQTTIHDVGFVVRSARILKDVRRKKS